MPKTTNIIDINEAAVRQELSEVVRGTVEETLNAMLDAEADRLCGASRYERSDARKDTRAGHYERNLETKAGKVRLKVPKLRQATFETSIIDRYRRRESSVEEALMEMYLAGVSVRRVEDITEALWGTRVSSGTVSNLNKDIYAKIEKWRNRRLSGSYPYVYLDGIVLKRSWGGEVKNVSVLVAIGVNEQGYREVLGAMEGHKEDKSGWGGFLAHLKDRGLAGVELFINDRNGGLIESLDEHFPDTPWQRCVVHFYRNVFSKVPRSKGKAVSLMLKAVHAQEDKEAAKRKAAEIEAKLREMKLGAAANCVKNGIHETFSYFEFPSEHWTRIKTNNPMERIMREIRRRTRVVGAFPDGQSALMLTCARLRHVAGSKWGTMRYLSMEYLAEMKNLQETG
jgi:putative transposase